MNVIETRTFCILKSFLNQFVWKVSVTHLHFFSRLVPVAARLDLHSSFACLVVKLEDQPARLPFVATQRTFFALLYAP